MAILIESKCECMHFLARLPILHHALTPPPVTLFNSPLCNTLPFSSSHKNCTDTDAVNSFSDCVSFPAEAGNEGCFFSVGVAELDIQKSGNSFFQVGASGVFLFVGMHFRFLDKTDSRSSLILSCGERYLHTDDG